MASSKLQVDIEDFFKETLKKELTKVFEVEFEKIKEEFLKSIDKQKDEILAGITLHFMRRMEMTRHGEILTIELRTKEVS